MSNSKLASVTLISPNKNSPRNKPIDRISIHCFVGQVTAKRGCEVFQPTSKKASCNYVVGYDGSIGLCVDEGDRSWCTSSPANDHRAVTIETASDNKDPYAVTDKAYAALLNLVEDICRRNGKTKLLWLGDKDKTLAFKPAADEMVLTVHRWFANKACPGQYLYDRHDEIAAEVTKRLGGTAPKEESAPSTDEAVAIKAGTALKLSKTPLFRSSTAKTASGYKTGTFYIWSDEVVKGRVRITNSKNRVGVAGQVTGWIDVAEAQANGTTVPKEEPAAVPYLVKVTATALNVRRGPGTNYGISTTIRDKGVYTIVQEQDGWGKLKSGAGWIKLSYTKKV